MRAINKHFDHAPHTILPGGSGRSRAYDTAVVYQMVEARPTGSACHGLHALICPAGSLDQPRSRRVDNWSIPFGVYSDSWLLHTQDRVQMTCKIRESPAAETISNWLDAQNFPRPDFTLGANRLILDG